MTFKKGRGVKSKTILTVAEADMSEEKLKLCCTSEFSPPRLLMFMDEDKCTSAYVISDGCTVSCNNVDGAAEIFIILLDSYYYFDLSYPRIFSQLLGFVQNFVLKETYSLEQFF